MLSREWGVVDGMGIHDVSNHYYLSLHSPPSGEENITNRSTRRYEIPSAETADWESAEKHIKAGKKTTVVSVKTVKQSKRKAGETAAEIYEQEIGGGKSKKSKKSKGGKK